MHSSERLKGKLIEATGTGLRLVRLRYEKKIAKSGSGRRQSARRFERQDPETLIERKEIRTIRLRPRKTTRYKYRLLGVLAGIPPDLLWAMQVVCLLAAVKRTAASAVGTLPPVTP